MSEAYYEEMAEDQRPAAMVRRQETPAAMARVEPVEQSLRCSSDTGALMVAIAGAQRKFAPLIKHREAKIEGRGNYRYKYANLSDVMDAIGDALTDSEIVVMQIPTGGRLITRIMHAPSLQWIEGDMPLLKPDARQGTQALGSALTYTRRYMLTSMLGIVPGDVNDDDGAAAQAEDNRPARRAPAAPQRSLRDVVTELSLACEPTDLGLSAALAGLEGEMDSRSVDEDVRKKARADLRQRVQSRIVAESKRLAEIDAGTA